MAGDWFPMRVDIHNDPDILRVRILSAWDAHTIVGACAQLWGWASQHSVDGVIHLPPAEVDAYLDRPGFCKHLAAVGWLELHEDRVVILHYERWLGKGAKRRLQETRRKQAVRKMSASHADKKRTTGEESRGEKRREEYNPPKPPSGDDRDFDRFWEVYPRKVAKVAALKAWRKLSPDLALVELILAALARQKTSAAWTRDGGQFIPHPATWLNGRRWEDQTQPSNGVPVLFQGIKDWLDHSKEAENDKG